MKGFKAMKKFLRWVWISGLLSGCVLHETVDSMQIIDDIPLHQPTEILVQNEEQINCIEIDGLLKESFVQGKDNQQLVYHDIEGQRVDAGPVFLDYRCNLNSDNLILYGHSSRTSQILFTPLTHYLDEAFARNHSELKLRINDCKYVYELISVFLFNIYEPSDNDWMQVNFEKEFLYQKAVERLKERSMFELNDAYGNQMLTLVTCNPDNHDERLIVIGMKKSA